MTPALRKSITDWEARHDLARYPFLTCLEPEELIKVYLLQTAQEIWARLSDEYGQISDLKHTKAE
jgi:hypothetical protein